MLAASEGMPAELARSVPLPRPASGAASRVQLGRAELVLEHGRGGYSLLWSDGREARRYVLGLHDKGQLSVELRAPRHALRLVPREVVTIVPGARLRGYVTVPLVPTVVWRDGPGKSHTLLELHPKGLQGLWDERRGAHALRCPVSWLSRFPFRSGEPQAIVPLRLYNDGVDAWSPSELAFDLCDDDLVNLRGVLLVRPRRVRSTDEQEFDL